MGRGLKASSFGKTAGFSTLLKQVAGHHRACPSATLDKGY